MRFQLTEYMIMEPIPLTWIRVLGYQIQITNLHSNTLYYEKKGGNDYGIRTNMGFSYTEYPNTENLDVVFQSCRQLEKAIEKDFTSPDGTKYLIAGVGHEWLNSTHYTDNNLCDFILMKKHLEDQIINAISEYCGSINKAGFDNPYEYWFANQTHYLDSDTRVWQFLEDNDVPLVLPDHWKNVYMEGIRIY